MAADNQGGIVDAGGPRMPTVGQYMTRDMWRVPSDLSVWSALAVMREHDIRHLLIVDDDVLAGVLSNRDYRRLLDRMEPDGSIRGLDEVRVSEIMTPAYRVVAVGAGTPLLDAVELIVRRGIGCLPVVDDQGHPVGLLTQKMLLASLGTLLGQKPRRRPRRRVAHRRGRPIRLSR
jgi:acetoin utilization protein AcuB